ncbi:MAG: HU family DNA-binding protein [Alloprevotella sp.]
MYYDIKSMPTALATNGKSYFLEPVYDGVFTLEDLCRHATHATALTAADMKAAMTVLAEATAEALAMGKRVNYEGLGSFSLKLTADAELGGTDEKVGKKVRVKDVNFRPAKQLMAEFETMSFHRTTTPRPYQWDEQPKDYAARLAAYFREHDVLRSVDAERLWHCRRTKACALLKAFCEQGLIRNAGTARAPFYVAGK